MKIKLGKKYPYQIALDGHVSSIWLKPEHLALVKTEFKVGDLVEIVGDEASFNKGRKAQIKGIHPEWQNPYHVVFEGDSGSGSYKAKHLALIESNGKDPMKEEVKFKVGDQVEIDISGYVFHGYKGRIEQIDFERPCPYKVNLGNNQRIGYYAENLILIETKFEIGDRVEVVGDNCKLKGHKGRVKDVDPLRDDLYLIALDEGRIHYYKDRSLALIKSDASKTKFEVGDYVTVVNDRLRYKDRTGQIISVDPSPRFPYHVSFGEGGLWCGDKDLVPALVESEASETKSETKFRAGDYVKIIKDPNSFYSYVGRIESVSANVSGVSDRYQLSFKGSDATYWYTADQLALLPYSEYLRGQSVDFSPEEPTEEEVEVSITAGFRVGDHVEIVGSKCHFKGRKGRVEGLNTLSPNLYQVRLDGASGCAGYRAEHLKLVDADIEKEKPKMELATELKIGDFVEITGLNWKGKRGRIEKIDSERKFDHGVRLDDRSFLLYFRDQDLVLVAPNVEEQVEMPSKTILSPEDFQKLDLEDGMVLFFKGGRISDESLRMLRDFVKKHHPGKRICILTAEKGWDMDPSTLSPEQMEKAGWVRKEPGFPKRKRVEFIPLDRPVGFWKRFVGSLLRLVHGRNSKQFSSES